MQLEAFYVFLSRVKKGSNLRILPIVPGGDLDHLLKFKRKASLRCWLGAYDEHGNFQEELFKKQIVMLSTDPDLGFDKKKADAKAVKLANKPVNWNVV